MDDEKVNCTWPHGTCANYIEQSTKPDTFGRVWMHCDEGLTLSKASMGRFMTFCLTHNVELGDVSAFSPGYPRSQVGAAIRIHPSLFASFEAETGGKLRAPPVPALN